MYLSEGQKVELCENRALAMLRVPLTEMVGLLGKDELPVIEDCLPSVILHVHVAFFPRFYKICTVSCCPQKVC